MSKKKKILIVGAGGIGSFLIPLFDKVSLDDVTVADPTRPGYNPPGGGGQNPGYLLVR